MKIKLTMAQALLRFLANQYVTLDNKEYRFINGVFGIFGHGNVTGLGEALEYDAQGLIYYQGHNEQGMAHAATAYAKHKNRLGIMACTSSIGPGATNMITAAATATTNRIPLLLLPGDVFSCRQPDPVLQQLEVPYDYTISVNDCFKPVSKYWDRITRPEQLMTACMQAMRVLTDPVETGAVTLCLPQDVQSEAYEYEDSFFKKRLWRIERERISDTMLAEAIQLLRKAKQPLIIAGGGVHYSLASETLSEFALKYCIPVAETQAGKSSLAAKHPMNVGGVGVTGSEAANSLAAQADVILVIGSRLQDFTTASKWAFKNQECQIIHLNVSRLDAMKMNGIMLKGDAKTGLQQLGEGLEGYQTSLSYQQLIRHYQNEWSQELDKLTQSYSTEQAGLHQTTVLGLLNQYVTEEDVIISAAGSLPGDLHRIWQSKKAKDYHLEYAYSCMGYEVAAGLGVRIAKENQEGEVYVLVGDGSFVMMHSELLTAIQERKKITILIFDNHGFQCIRNLQEGNGSLGFGNEFRYRQPTTNTLNGDYLPIDFCKYAEGLGATTYFAKSYEQFRSALDSAKKQEKSTVIVLPILPKSMSQGYKTWWRVGVAEVSQSESVSKAYQMMQEQIETVRQY
ncbi:TPA: 3D-(3,5/4)-trihydroxycyclohexane-1,2-dione acylhydrolase (decyclizing) [Legionella pneumophila]|nr:3D-(3,5/4)-trihydroxycyclohexane-1,2-dione acylhydrolase (decyclizing) [Legionella pneumophila]HAT1822614.1 3D-(3,5/4)-trihydroxycyclohexane-1,2-dione acylhydrolase (decyclizing) [Legionella pneumophila]HAT1923485.1 3D-(3,5/4)-trihydroxycyclohexane-1,2-dione acylhydrolase (decyclizing) [Legionella pneumophila]HAT7769465.1 3D-(3,5/4)-trihydroxycyclohexane-1,2-dione acylhydrolase (decyclizing) [Legionella pneumophila]HAU1638205.1 3D-(3,5/4)-trihydroxycyclohexane-1,2-dione acylhydrolase (decycl